MIGQKVGGYRGIEKRSEKRPASALVVRATGTLLAHRGIYAPHLAAESQASAMSELQEHRNQSHSLTQPQRPLAGVRREEALQAGGRSHTCHCDPVEGWCLLSAHHHSACAGQGPWTWHGLGPAVPRLLGTFTPTALKQGYLWWRKLFFFSFNHFMVFYTFNHIT